ncbi:MAG: site-2 protease family protein [Candidatus Peribacteraceae bacterium]|jgi:Zn-dependent protease
MSPFFSPPFIIAILIALSIHEWAHGMVAYKLGDPTAKLDGRLTVNPLAHLDPIGAVMFLMVGFGWAKPVPVNPQYFKHPKRDTMFVSLAGPFSNLVLAFLAFFLLFAINSGNVGSSAMSLLLPTQAPSLLMQVVEQILKSSIFINLALMAFNLLPIAPLDGSKILRAFIPSQHEFTYEVFMQRGPSILLILILAGMFLGIPILSTWVFGIMSPFLNLMNFIAQML